MITNRTSFLSRCIGRLSSSLTLPNIRARYLNLHRYFNEAPRSLRINIPNVKAIALLTTLTLSGCAVVSPESVKLSSTVGQDLAAIKKSHLFYINSYYERLESQANNAVDQIFAPSIISSALNGKSGAVLFKKLEDGKNGGEQAKDAIDFTNRFLSNVRNLVEGERNKVLTPIRAAKKSALDNVEEAYSQVLQGNSTITAYLASLVKIRESQDQLFASAGLPDLQDKAGKLLSGGSDEIGKILTQATEKETKLDDLKNEITKVLNKGTDQPQ